MSAHHNEHSNQHYYEGDQSKLYSGVMNHHFNHDVKGEESKKQIKRIWKVTAILAIVTIVEVALGLASHHMGVPRGIVNTLFLIMTIFKAGYIVSVFMHLGDELKNFMIMVLIPLTLFVWFIIAFLADGGFWLHMNHSVPVR